MFRISPPNPRHAQAIWTMEGSFTGAALESLELAVAQQGLSPDMILDLSGVHFIDGPSAASLRALRAQGVELRDAPLFITQLLGPT